MPLAAGGLDLLNVNPGLVIWTLVTFLIVVLILKKFAWSPILDALDERAETIHKDINQAKDLKTEAEVLFKKHKDQMDAAVDEANKIVNEAKSDASNLKSKMLNDVQLEIKNLKDQASKDIELAKAQAILELRNETVEMSVNIAGQILQKQLKKDDFKAFAESEIDKLKSLKIKNG